MTAILLVTNVAAFVVQGILGFFSSFPVIDFFALSLRGLAHGFIWQLITFQLMHAGWIHLLVNCWAIYVFGRGVEMVTGKRRFLAIYFSSGIAGGLLQVLFAWVWPDRFGGAVVGASAGALGLVGAFAAIEPERKLMMLVYFVFPLKIRAKTFLLFCFLLSVLGLLFPNSFLGGGIAHAAHLGGILTGFVSTLRMLRAPTRNFQITAVNT